MRLKIKRREKVLVGDLYRLDFADGKSYIGASLGGSRKRYKGHQILAESGNSSPVHVAWRELGAPKLVILKKGVLEGELWLMEKLAIQSNSTKIPYGYNAYNASGRAPGWFGKTPSDRSRGLMRQSQLNRWKNNPLSDEQRLERSLIQKKRFLDNPVSDKTKHLLRQANLGKVASDETKDRCRLASLGRKMSAETIVNMSLAALKRFQNPDEREKNRLGQIKRWQNLESREEQSRVQQIRWFDPDEHEKASRAQRKRHRDHPVSNETRKKQREAALRRYRTEEVDA